MQTLLSYYKISVLVKHFSPQAPIFAWLVGLEILYVRYIKGIKNASN